MTDSKSGCNWPLIVEWNQGPREYQEDYYGVFNKDKKTLLVIADGMGGHTGGDLASRWTVEELGNTFGEFKDVEALFETSTRKVLARMKDSGKDMGCTLVAALIEKENGRYKLTYTWIGDSRLYLLSSGGKPSDNAKVIDKKNNQTLWLLTDDDSFVWGFYLNNELTIDQLTQHPNKNQLEFSIHPRQKSVDSILIKRLRTVYLEENDKVFLCTDGIWESYLSQSQILTHMNDSYPGKTIQSHLKKALRENQFNDNGTFILAEMSDKLFSQNCIPQKVKKRFFSSLVLGFLFISIFVLIFFFLTGKFSSQTKNSENIQIPGNRETVPPKLSQKIEYKKKKNQEYFTILIGPYPNYQTVKIAYNKFINLGYAVKIISPEEGQNGFFQLSLGHYYSINQAKKEKITLKKHEDKKFSIVKNY